MDRATGHEYEQPNVTTAERRRMGNVTGPRALRDTPPGRHYRPADQRADGESLANFLGWFSIGLGVAQVVAPGSVARMIGVANDRRSRSTLRAVGVREITSGVGILTRPRPAGWVWSRVAGDLMDMSLLGRAMSDDEGEPRLTRAATAAVAGIAVLDVICAQQLSRDTDYSGDGDDLDEEEASAGAYRRTRERGRRSTRSTAGPDAGTESTIATNGKSKGKSKLTRQSITVGRPLDEVYRYWHDFENLPRFMRHLESVKVTGPRTSHWKAKAPAGMSVEWDAEIVEDRPNELIAWRSMEGSDVRHEGTVRFVAAPGDRGTEVRVELEYDPPGGTLGTGIAKLFREEPSQQLQDDLRAFKQVMEIGEVVRSDASVHSGPHPAQPSDEPINL
jgi:uncharacterized membrane protein